jgi:hypothetical protein
MDNIVSAYLDLLDLQREIVFDALQGLSDTQLWQRPTPKAWSIGEILYHNYLLFATTYPAVRLAWKYLHKRGERLRNRPYAAEIDDIYRRPTFPMWVGFLWRPKYSAKNPVPLDKIQAETRSLHTDFRLFYTGKDEDILGNVYLYDPVFGWCNLIVTLRIGIYHDQLHLDDVINLVQIIKR